MDDTIKRLTNVTLCRHHTVWIIILAATVEILIAPPTIMLYVLLSVEEAGAAEYNYVFRLLCSLHFFTCGPVTLLI